MSTSTFGTALTTSLTATIFFTPAPPADTAAIQNAIKDDQNVAHPVYPGAYSSMGLLYVPNRGILKLLPGDWVAVDSQGWPILVSGNSAASASWTHNP